MKNELETLRAELHKEVDAKIDKLIKPEFEVDKWYKSTVDKSIYCITEFNGIGQIGRNYGFNYNGDWMELDKRTFDKDTTKEVRLATPSEVQEALEKEAVKRYKGNNKVKCLLINSIVTFDLECEVWFNEINNSLFVGRIKLFDNGIWAEIQKTMTIDELINDLYNKNHYRLGVYIKDNKTQIIETLNNL